MERMSVFLVDSKDSESGLIRAAIEGAGHMRVYNFFDLHEIFYYLKLMPKAIFYYRETHDPVDTTWIHRMEGEMEKFPEMKKVHLVGIKNQKQVPCAPNHSSKIVRNCIVADSSFSELVSSIRKIVAE
jgi:hypothetical protein